MINFANIDDKENIISLWQKAFSDNCDYVERFIDNYCSIENILVYKVEKDVVSMLCLLPCKIVILGKEYNSRYIYAACTDINHQGKGYMSKLIEAAKSFSNGYDFLLLSPANDSLYDFYGRFGFKTAFKEKVISINRKQLKLIADSFSNDKSYKSTQRFPLEMLRNTVFEDFDFVKWNNSHIEYALSENSHIVDRYGYVLYNEEDDKCTIKEICPALNNFGKLVNSLLSKTSANIFEFRLPILYPFTHQNEIIKNSGMLCCLNKSLKDIFDTIYSAYLGLKLD